MCPLVFQLVTSPGRQLATVPEDAFDLRQELRDVKAQKAVAVRMQATLRMGGRAIYFRFFLCFVCGRFFFLGGGLCFPASLIFCFSAFLASLLFCFSASLPVCFSASLLLCLSAFLLFVFPASRLLCFLLSLLPCFSAFRASLLFCFSAFLLCFSAFCFAASLFSMLLCFCASVPFYFYYSTFSFL